MGEGAAPVTGPGHALGGGVVGALLFLSSMSKEPWKEVARNPGGLILESLITFWSLVVTTSLGLAPAWADQNLPGWVTQ